MLISWNTTEVYARKTLNALIRYFISTTYQVRFLNGVQNCEVFKKICACNFFRTSIFLSFSAAYTDIFLIGYKIYILWSIGLKKSSIGAINKLTFALVFSSVIFGWNKVLLKEGNKTTYPTPSLLYHCVLLLGTSHADIFGSGKHCWTPASPLAPPPEFYKRLPYNIALHYALTSVKMVFQIVVSLKWEVLLTINSKLKRSWVGSSLLCMFHIIMDWREFYILVSV